MSQNLPNNDSSVIWFSRILRWGLGLFFSATGIIYFDKGAWPAIIFGIIIFITGFFKPVRCLNDSCDPTASK